MTPVVNTSSGRIRGVHEEGVLAFHGIPYAQPPVGPLRFCPRSSRWPGRVYVRPTLVRWPCRGPTRSHRRSGPSAMSEDCLYLNVWTPATDDARRPVLVWLHGGAFLFRAGSTTTTAPVWPRGAM